MRRSISVVEIEFEDDEFSELEDERDTLLQRVEELEDIEGQLEDLQEKWNDRNELFKRIGELA